MAGERTSRSRRSSGGNIPVRQQATTQLRDTARATGGRRVDPGAVQDPIRNVQSLNRALSGFFGAAIQTLEQLKDEDAKDQIAHERALNSEQKLEAQLDAAKGKKNEELFKTDWDYRLAHKAATTGKEIGAIRREEAKKRSQDASDKYLRARGILQGGDANAIGSSGRGVQHDAALFATGVVNAAGQKMLDLGLTSFKGLSAEEIAAKKAEMAHKFADDYIKNNGLENHPHKDAIALHLRGAVRKVLGQAEGHESNRRRVAERREAAAVALEKVRGNLSQGDITGAEGVLVSQGDGPATARAKVIGALGLMMQRGEISPQKAISMARAKAKGSNDPSVRASYSGLLKTALKMKRMGSEEQKVAFTKLTTRGVELSNRAVNEGMSAGVQSALKQYELDVRRAFRDKQVTEQGYQRLLTGITRLTAAVTKGQAESNALNHRFQTGGAVNGNTSQKEKRTLFTRLQQSHMDQQGEASFGETAQQPDPGQAVQAAAAEMIRRNLSPPKSFLAPLIADVKNMRHNGERGLNALNVLSRLDAVKPGVMAGDLREVAPYLAAAKHHGLLNAGPEKAERAAETIEDRAKRTDPVDYFWQGETGDENKRDFVNEKVRDTLKELNGDRKVQVNMNTKDLVKLVVREAHLQGIPLGSGDDGFKAAMQRLIDTKAISIQHVYDEDGDVSGSVLKLGADKVATISPSTAIGPDKETQIKEVISFVRNAFTGEVVQDGKKITIGFDGGPLDLRSAGMTFVPTQDGKGYKIATAGGQPVRIVAGGMIGRIRPQGVPTGQKLPDRLGARFEVKDHMAADYWRYRKMIGIMGKPIDQTAFDAHMKTLDERYTRWQSDLRNANDRDAFLKANPEPFHPSRSNFQKFGNERVSGGDVLRMPEGLTTSQAKAWLVKNVPMKHGLSFHVVERNGIAIAAELRVAFKPISATPNLDKKTGGN